MYGPDRPLTDVVESLTVAAGLRFKNQTVKKATTDGYGGEVRLGYARSSVSQESRSERCVGCAEPGPTIFEVRKHATADLRGPERYSNNVTHLPANIMSTWLREKDARFADRYCIINQSI